jgi:hypothetical protein
LEAYVTNYQNDPNINRRNQAGYRNNTSYTGWIIGGIIALALIIGGFVMFSRQDGTTSSASNTNSPAVTTTVPGRAAPATTGSATPSPAPATGGTTR